MPEDSITDKQYIAELESLVENYHAFIFKHSPSVDRNPEKLLLLIKTSNATKRRPKQQEDPSLLEWQDALELMYKIFICYDTIRSETTPEPIREGMLETMERYRTEMREMAQHFRMSYPADTKWCCSECLHTGTFFCAREQKWYCDRHAEIMHPDGECYGRPAPPSENEV